VDPSDILAAYTATFVGDPGPQEPAGDPSPPEPPNDVTASRSGRHLASSTRKPAHQRYPVLDWSQVFDGVPDDVDWLVPDMIARGQSYSLVSPAKAGKSLLMLDVAAAVATGRTTLGNRPQQPARVLYVDHENSRDDLVERLREMNYRPDELGNLRYLSFPTMPPLDGPVGGLDIVEIADHHDAALVVIDTVARVVAGEENSADTYRNLYRHTLSPLKAKGRTVVRLDHQGKEKTGARGSSAKNDDVDVVWQLNQLLDDDGEVLIRLKLERQRGTSHPDHLLLRRETNPLLRHVLRPDALTPTQAQRVGDCVEALIRLRIPADTGSRKARVALREQGHRFSNDTIAAAVRARKAALTFPETAPETLEGMP
jgi:hypothetical protein